FREHKNFLGTAVERGKKGSARVGIRQIQTNAFQRTGRLFFCENLFFVREDFRQIDLDPLQRRRQFQAVWPRIETRGKVQHQVRALLQLLFDEMVEEVSSRDRKSTRLTPVTSLSRMPSSA